MYGSWTKNVVYFVTYFWINLRHIKPCNDV